MQQTRDPALDVGADVRSDVGWEIDCVAASGSCARCGRALDLASAKVGGRWYGNAICATGAPCPLDREPPAVPEPRLYSRPRRYLRRRLPKELKAGSQG